MLLVDPIQALGTRAGTYAEGEPGESIAGWHSLLRENL